MSRAARALGLPSLPIAVAGITLAVTAGAAAPAAAQSGPRKTVAVLDFAQQGAFVSKYGAWDVGCGLAAMLEAQLLRCQAIPGRIAALRLPPARARGVPGTSRKRSAPQATTC